MQGESMMTTVALQHVNSIGMKRDTTIYWTTTGIVSSIMLVSAVYFGFSAEAKGAFSHLGLPGYLRIELTVAKILGALALLIPAVPQRVKEFAYFGIAITIVSAIIAHAATGDGMSHVVDPLLILGILVVSYVYHHKRERR
jgi:DoxX-like family